jgi:hypothetical protein
MEEYVLDPSGVLRQRLLRLSRSGRMRDLIERAPVSRDVVRRFMAGESTADAVRAAAGRIRRGPYQTRAVSDAGRIRSLGIQWLSPRFATQSTCDCWGKCRR